MSDAMKEERKRGSRCNEAISLKQNESRLLSLGKGEGIVGASSSRGEEKAVTQKRKED